MKQLRRLKTLTLRKKLTAAFLLVMLVPSIIVSSFSYQAAYKQTDRQLLDSATTSVTASDRAVTQTIQAKIADLEYYSTTMTASDNSAEADEDILKRLQVYLKMHAEAVDMFVGTPEGKLIIGKAVGSTNDPRERPWYKQAMEKPGQTVISPVGLNTAKVPVVYISRTLPDNSGVLGLSLNLNNLKEITNLKIGQNGYIMILDGTKRIVTHPTEVSGSTKMGETIPELFASKEGSFSYDINGVDKHLIFKTNTLTGWRIAGTMDKAETSASAQPILITTIIVLVIAAIIIGVLAMWLISSILKPIQRLRNSMDAISQGNLSINVATTSTDEIGELSRYFQQMVDNLRNMIKEIQAMTGNLSASSQELAAGAEQTTRAIEHVTIAIQDVAAGSERQVGSAKDNQERISGMATDITAMTETMAEMTTYSAQAIQASDAGSEHIGNSVVSIDGIRTTVEELDTIISALSDRSGRIGTIVTVITEIASQTNLLALNASIEAARAGEHGKGFAVVATEVRKLAENSAYSAQQIREQIQGIQSGVSEALIAMESAKERVSDGINSIDLSGRSFSRIRRAVAKSAKQLDNVAASTAGVADGTSSVVSSMEEITRIAEEAASHTETVSAAAEEQLASMEEIGSSAADLTRLAEQLQDLLTQFQLDETK
ncbi:MULTISPECIES: methyl-accepting chemotaxis protein [Paenibacillus]|jgi:methyl-accepting chemotaxis protein|uniref:Chemotaxis protein n=2 Tax=Paenibacillus TaxID=44249 RepID=A0ABX2Z5S0_PAEPO|nr:MULTISPECIES: methyl-accepting chemotaxis protein [Paenibacillus]AIW41339.1 chemotaxis protein [Paenibacillus polymyxa CR1]ALA43610.1 chemotaxis protein [Paenibacillus peoriae]APQ60905.1 chemotaxis protein [Paenibacillus polymyxa]MCP3746107.1 methyl-accepting chemotaxis protein [Paenibacillus sp. A3M_27_13]MDR6779834.1 methyl-accepting chemotaxis protein [Paenibacillus peoriae]